MMTCSIQRLFLFTWIINKKMKVRVNRKDYTYNIAYDANGDILDYDQGNIDGSWLNNEGNVRSVSFSKSPSLSIGDFSFYNCGILGDLIIPDNFISIGRNAFTQSNGITDVYINMPESSIFNGVDSVNSFYNGPIGKLYVTSQHIASYGGEGAVYPATLGMEVALWNR